MRGILLLSSILLFVIRGSAQYESDTLAYAEPDSMIDMSSLIPAGDWYNQWDTAVVHYYGPATVEMFANKALKLVYDKECDFFFPVPNGRITSKWGPRGRRGRMHKGVDIDLESGDPVYAAFEGMVRISQYSSSYGNVVILRHPNGLETYYAHLSKLNVRPGEYVMAGQEIGLGGNTGRSYGSHLHFEIRFLGQAINPAIIIDLAKHELATVEYIPYKYGKGKDSGIFARALQEKFHQVRPGDDLHVIAELYCVPVTTLMSLNNISENASLLIDAKIRYQ